MAKYIRPKDVSILFEQLSLDYEVNQSFWRSFIEPAETLGFRVSAMEFAPNVSLVYTPQRKNLLYAGFGKSQFAKGMMLAHAMFTSKLH